MCHLYSHKQRHSPNPRYTFTRNACALTQSAHTITRHEHVHKKRDWICKNAPTEQNRRPLFYSGVCLGIWSEFQSVSADAQRVIDGCRRFFYLPLTLPFPSCLSFPHISPPLFERRRNFIVICTTATARHSSEINFLIVRLPPTKSSKLRTSESCR